MSLLNVFVEIKMTDNDKKDFALMMRVTWANYGRNEPDKDTMRYWYSKLDKHDFNVVTKAFDDWIFLIHESKLIH